MAIKVSRAIDVMPIHHTKSTHNWLQIPIWLGIIGLWSILTIGLVLVPFTWSGALYDYNAYYNAAQRLNHGVDLYLSIEAYQTYLYPPLLAHALAPLAASISFEETAIVWTIFNLFCVILSIILLTSQIQNQWKRYAVWLMPVTFVPILETFLQGQVVPILLLLITGAWVAYRSNKAWITGGLLAIATWLKIYPVFIILYFILRRDWRVVASALLIGMVVFGLQISWSELDTMITYFTVNLPNLAAGGQELSMFYNHSLLGLTSRLFEHKLQLATVSRSVGIGLMVLAMIGINRYANRSKLSQMKLAEFDLEYAMMIVFMLLFGGTLFSSGLLPILLAIAIAIKYGQNWRDYSIILILFLLMSLTLFFVFANSFGNQHPIIQGYGTYSMILLWGLLGYLRWTHVRQPVHSTGIIYWQQQKAMVQEQYIDNYESINR
jgi:hypothetical protein